LSLVGAPRRVAAAVLSSVTLVTSSTQAGG